MYEYDYTTALDAIAPGITADVSASQAPGETWMDSLMKLLPVLATTYQQKQLLEVQVERARAGLAPLDVSMYAPGVKVGVDEGTKQLLIFGGIALAGLMLLGMMRKR